ncbi:MAG: MerR family transcriptional regulator [Gemmatimonadales bacterium]|jgi:DNA-binding transcriptional MerR regulator/methylmalonyl-CoA mutase cobalamin-binding subunit
MADRRNDAERKRHPIQVVVRRTGLTADVLRAWEKRYGVVEPGRSAGGRRLYSDRDIERLRLLRRATGAGRRISQIAGLATEELAALVKEDEREEAVVAVEPDVETLQAAEVHLRDALAAVGKLDARELEAVLGRAMVTLSAAAFVERVAAPFLRRVGELWSHGEVSPANEHLASAVMLRVIGRVIEAAEPSSSALSLVLATPAHELHEFGALFAAATAAAEGWRVTYLGRDLPASDIAAAARETSADAVGLSIVYAPDRAVVESELRELRKQLAVNAPLLVGGAAAPSLKEVLDEIEAVQLSGMDEFRTMLAQLS